jgi:hypothetical protein
LALSHVSVSDWPRPLTHLSAPVGCSQRLP